MKKNLSIWILMTTAAFLLAGNLFIPTPASAIMAIKDRDYQLVTARIQSGGDGLYIVDSRTGLIAVFTYDPASRSVRPRQVRLMSDAFPGVR